MEAEILATGSELLTPDRSDTNSLWLTARLDELGLEVRRKTIVGDDLEVLSQALREAVRRSDLVICTGGLGPTEDDVTRQAAAAATGRPLRSDPDLAEQLRRRFASRGLPMPENNLRQALVPEGAEVLENRVGTAPGLLLTVEDRLLALLPGPPREMQPMFDEHLLPRLRPRSGPVRVVRRLLKVTGLTESGMDARIAPLAANFPAVRLTVNFTPLDLEIRLSARGPGDLPEKTLDELCAVLRLELGEALYSEAGEGLEQVVATLLQERGLDLAVGEVGSLGLVAARLLSAGAPLRAALATGEASGDDPGLPGLWPMPVDHQTALASAEKLWRSTGAALSLVVGKSNWDGERAWAAVALCDARGSHCQDLRLVAARDLAGQRASQAALDVLRRHLMLQQTVAD